MFIETLSTLKINKLTQEQYERELAAGNIDETALYLTPDEEIDLSGYATSDQLNAKANTSDLTNHTGNKSNPHGVTASQIGLGNVENKSSATIRGEITSANITTALGYTPYTPTEVDTKLSGKANTSHGNHVPTTETANNAKFLRNDNTWQTVTPANIGASASSHTHDYLPLSGGTLTGTLDAKRINATNEYLTGSLYVGGKTSTSDGKTGVAFGASGNVSMQSSGDPTLQFFSGSVTTPQVKLAADESGSLKMKGNLVIGNEQDNGGLFMKNTSGTLLNVLGVGKTNNLSIGAGFFNAKSGYTHIYGGEGIAMHLPDANGNTEAVAFRSSRTSGVGNPCFYPHGDGTYYLGISSNKWSTIYSKYGTINTSDEREKENIIPMGASHIMTLALDGESEPIDIYSELFDRLIPVEYNFINNSGGRTYYGLVAQQVISAMEDIGLEENELDLVHHEYYTDEKTGEEKDTYGINYNNLIALLIHEVQKLKAEVSALKSN